MSDDQPTREESSIPFSERVTIDTLKDRPEIPSFDSSVEQWEGHTGLRLEGQLVGDYHKLPDYLGVGEKVVVIIGPEDFGEGRGIAVYHQETGQRESSLDQHCLASVNIEHPPVGRPDEVTVIRRDEEVNIPFHPLDSEIIGYRDETLTLKVESIRSGPLT